MGDHDPPVVEVPPRRVVLVLGVAGGRARRGTQAGRGGGAGVRQPQPLVAAGGRAGPPRRGGRAGAALPGRGGRAGAALPRRGGRAGAALLVPRGATGGCAVEACAGAVDVVDRA